jgi:hypothetical protein
MPSVPEPTDDGFDEQYVYDFDVACNLIGYRVERMPKRSAAESERRRAAYHALYRILLSAPPSERPEAPKPVAKPRPRRPSPSRLAKWEAHWQAEQATEGDQ